MKRLLALFTTMIALVFTTAARADLMDGLVGYWPFDGDAKDYSGNENNGSIHGTKLVTDRHGLLEKAMLFGSGNYITVPNSSSLNSVSHQISIGAWIKVDKWYGNYWAALFAKGNYQYCFNLTPYNSQPNPLTEIASNVGADFTGVSFLGNWVHVAVTFGSDKICRAYVNGAFYKSVACPNGSFPASSHYILASIHHGV